MAYLSLEEFKAIAVIPRLWIEAIELVEPGFTLQQLDYWSDWIDTRLRKRYDVPFGTPVPNMIKGWLARIVTVRVMLRRGVDPTDEQFTELKRDDSDARAELAEAADSDAGLFDLPLREDMPLDASGIVRGSPKVYSEQSPYVSLDRQRHTGRGEDDSGSGTGGSV
jgi:hypothetical protein